MNLKKALIEIENESIEIGSGRIEPNSVVRSRCFETYAGDEVRIFDSNGHEFEVELSNLVLTREEWNKFADHYEIRSDLHSQIVGLITVALIEQMGELVLKTKGTKLSINRLAEEIVGLSPKVTGAGKTKVSEHIDAGLRSIKRHDLL